MHSNYVLIVFQMKDFDQRKLIENLPRKSSVQLGTMAAFLRRNSTLFEHNSDSDSTVIPPTSVLSPEDKCRQFVSLEKISEIKKKQERKKNFSKSRDSDQQYFDPPIPKHFRAMCAAALRCFVIRHEQVMISNGLKVR